MTGSPFRYTCPEFAPSRWRKECHSNQPSPLQLPSNRTSIPLKTRQTHLRCCTQIRIQEQLWQTFCRWCQYTARCDRTVPLYTWSLPDMGCSHQECCSVYLFRSGQGTLAHSLAVAKMVQLSRSMHFQNIQAGTDSSHQHTARALRSQRPCTDQQPHMLPPNTLPRTGRSHPRSCHAPRSRRRSTGRPR